MLKSGEKKKYWSNGLAIAAVGQCNHLISCNLTFSTDNSTASDNVRELTPSPLSHLPPGQKPIRKAGQTDDDVATRGKLLEGR